MNHQPLNQIMKNLIENTTLQSFKKMTTSIALGLSLWTIPSTMVAAEPQSRPFYQVSHVEVLIDFRAFPQVTFVAQNTGVATHLGSFSGSTEGVVNIDFCQDPSSGEFFPCLFTPTGEGAQIAANGDSLLVHFTNPGGGPNSGVMTFTGGTGRFENATGSATQTQLNVVESDNGDGTTTLTYDDILTGSITY